MNENRYSIAVEEAAIAWLKRPIRVRLSLDTPTGSDTQSFYLDVDEAFELISRLTEFVSAMGNEEGLED